MLGACRRTPFFGHVTQTFVDRFVERFFLAPGEGFNAANSADADAYHVIGVHMRSGMAENSQDVRGSNCLHATGVKSVWLGLGDVIAARN